MNITENKKIKLIQIIGDADLGGGPKHVLGILKNVNKKKFDCYLICPKGMLADFAADVKGVTVLNVKFGSKFDLLSAFSIYETIHQIQSLKHPFSPVIAHFHGARAGFLGRLFVPKHIATVYTEHSLDQNFHLKNKMNEFVQKRFLARQNNKTSAIVAVSSSVRNYLVSNKLSPEDRTVVIANGIDLENFGLDAKTRKIKEENAHPVIGSIGNLNHQKGYQYLIKAMPAILKKYPLATLEIVGDGPSKTSLLSLVKQLKLTHHVAFLGKRININKHLLDWDVFVLPSVSETFGLVLLEAMKAGVPIVASKVGGITDIIEPDKNGLLVKSGDHAAITKDVLSILEHPVLAAKLKRGGLERVKRYDWRVVISNLEALYHNLSITIR